MNMALNITIVRLMIGVCSGLFSLTLTAHPTEGDSIPTGDVMVEFECQWNTLSHPVTVSISDVRTVKPLHQGRLLAVEETDSRELHKWVVAQLTSVGVGDHCRQKLMKNALIEYDADQQMVSVYFNFDESVLLPESRHALSQRLSLLRGAKSIVVTGHTDSVGSQRYNHALGQRRGESIQRYLVDNGIESQRVTVNSRGELQPVSSNMSVKGRADNRRAAVTWIFAAP